MLILTRKPMESLVINDNIKVTILGVRGAQVRIGVTAPSNVTIHREEIFDRIHESKGDAGLNHQKSKN